MTSSRTLFNPQKTPRSQASKKLSNSHGKPGSLGPFIASGPPGRFEGSKIEYILRLTLDPQNAFESIKSLGAYRFGPLFLQHSAFERCKKHYISSILYYFTWVPGNRLLAKMASKSIPQLGCANGCPKLDLAYKNSTPSAWRTEYTTKSLGSYRMQFTPSF